MINPNFLRPEDGNSVAVRSSPPPHMGGGRGNVSVARGLAVVNVYVVDDDVGHILKRQTTIPCDVDVSATTVKGLVTVEDELVLQLYDHVSAENDPERFVLDDGVAEGTRGGVYRVAVRRISHDIDPAPFSAQRTTSETD
ncbi:hypothetical protein SLE2022_068350 [Rubroshorea leprosula]